MTYSKHLDILNSEQKMAALEKGNVLVSASAGAGKTRVLISRLTNLIINERVSLDKIVAMTFTEAAAMSMRSKLEESLKEYLEENPDDGFVLDQISLLETSNISTIHSYCLSLLKEYYYLLPIKKERCTNIIDDGYKHILLKKAFEDVLKNNDLKDVIPQMSDGLYSLDRVEDAFNEILKKASSSYDPVLWLTSHKDKPITKFSDLDINIKNNFLSSIYLNIDLAIEILKEINTLVEDDRYKAYLVSLKDIRNLNDYESIVLAFETQKFDLPKGGQDDVKALKKLLIDKFEKIGEYLIPINTLINDHNASTAIINRLIDASVDYYNAYQKYKEEENLLDFEDFEHFAYRLLVNDDYNLSKKLKEKYKEILIDEFQDTSYTQYEIAKLISNNNLFLVGDTKQSIYKFRNAEVSIMQNIKNDPCFKVLNITKNYRSKENIINFNNDFYSSLFNIVDANCFKDEEKQSCGKESQKHDNVSSIILECNPNISKYRAISEEIIRLHSNGLAFRDIAILIKTRTDKNDIIDALKYYNIPYFFSDNESYLVSDSLNTIIDYLKVLLDEDNEIARVSVLTSSMYKLGDNDLLKLKNCAYRYEPMENDLNNLKELLENNKISEIINYLISINDYYYHLDEKDKANVALFIKNASSYDFKNIYDLLTFVEETKDNSSDASSIISESADVVRIVTIYHSKGLEYECVFVVSDDKLSDLDLNKPVLIDADLGISMDYMDTRYNVAHRTVKKQAIKAKKSLEDIMEYERVCYVATTRAIKYLYIVTTPTNDNKLSGKSLLFARKGLVSYINNIASSCLRRYIDKLDDLSPLEKIKKFNQIKPEYNCKFNFVEDNKPSSQDDNHLIYKEMVDYGTKVHKLFENLNLNKELDVNELLKDFEYPKAKVKSAITKFYNSELIQSIKNYDINKEFEFFINEGNKNTHGFMDFVAIGINEIVLVDYKTNANTTKEHLINTYKKQIDSYKDALSSSYKQNIKAYLYSTYLEEFIEI